MTRLKFERTNRRLTQHTVAVLTRIHQPVIAQIENGRLTPTPEQLERLAYAFRVAPEDLLRDVAVLGPSR